MELILIRHGQAEDRLDSQPDEERNLTKDGRKILTASMTGYGCFLKTRNAPFIWSSPLNRALQTAEMIASAIGVVSVSQYACIGSGDFEAFVKVLSEMDFDRTDDSLIIVGHEPWLSHWSRQLCGIILPFKKGAAAGFRFDPRAPRESELLWFAQPRILRRMKTLT